MNPTNDEPLEFAIRPYEIENPVSRAGLLFAQLNSVAASRRMNSITMHAIEHDAYALITVDPPGAHGVLGALAALRGRDEEVRIHYRIALEMAGSSAVPYLNFSIALLQVGDSAKAYRMALKAEKCAPEGEGVPPHLIVTAFEAGRFQETLAHCERWHAFNPETPLPSCGAARTIIGAIEHGTLSEKAAAKALRTANRVRGAEGVRPAATALYRDMRRPGELRYRIDVHTTREHAQDMSATVANRTTGTPGSPSASWKTLQIIFVAVQ